jgi:hypothetical protein
VLPFFQGLKIAAKRTNIRNFFGVVLFPKDEATSKKIIHYSLHYLGIYLNILLNISNRYHHHEYSLWIDSREVGRPCWVVECRDWDVQCSFQECEW